ncbi:ComF family protein [Aquabacterium sp.]|uniref:ComF family protein n=1 Tax=Aquabacterium sp. TaxID=1872578 RepID=UPI00248A3628|nr:ComF family protein [Aquabacterium sp.]MDI1259692.1 ComF family protein [Aquabacterium sp.]
MLSLPSPSLRWRLPWPGLCLVCQRAQWQAICHHCLSAFAPPRLRCQRCALTLKTGQSACTACEDYPPEFDRALAAVDYTSPWRELIARFKFQGDLALAKPLANLMAAQINALPPRARPHWIIPTPLSALRLRERGYNQSWQLARHLSRQTGIPTLPDALRRVKDTPRMMTLEADDRRNQIRGAFEVNTPWRRALVGRRVALVDDVLTTGATVDEITRTLQAAGVRSVSVWVVARTPAPGA